MATQSKPTAVPKRRRGRPLKEESNAIALDRAMLDFKQGISGLVPLATDALKVLLDKGSDNVKRDVAKFIIEEAKSIHNAYVEQDEEEMDAKNNKAGAVGDAGAEVEDEDDRMPLSTEVVEFKPPKEA